jgi:transposase
LKPKGKPDPKLYALKKEALSLLEHQSRCGHIDLLYGDESQVSEQGYVPYGWQFADEQISIAAAKGRSINCFGLLSRDNELIYKTTEKIINAAFVLTFLDELSLKITKPTVIVLDNARIHTARKIKERLKYWQQRGLYIFYLPPYSPHLNIIERLWRELKQRWLKPENYSSADNLFYSVSLALASVGKELFINFSPCSF